MISEVKFPVLKEGACGAHAGHTSIALSIPQCHVCIHTRGEPVELRPSDLLETDSGLNSYLGEMIYDKIIALFCMFAL